MNAGELGELYELGEFGMLHVMYTMCVILHTVCIESTHTV